MVWGLLKSVVNDAVFHSNITTCHSAGVMLGKFYNAVLNPIATYQ